MSEKKDPIKRCPLGDHLRKLYTTTPKGACEACLERIQPRLEGAVVRDINPYVEYAQDIGLDVNHVDSFVQHCREVERLHVTYTTSSHDGTCSASPTHCECTGTYVTLKFDWKKIQDLGHLP
jgi:hypothetical protein